MANQEQLDILKQGVEVWNEWRKKNSSVKINLSEVDLSEANLVGTDLSGANLIATNFSHANLSEVDLIIADLLGTNFSHADLLGTNFSFATLKRADLSHANLNRAVLSSAVLSEVNLTNAIFRRVKLSNTVLGDVDLSTVKGLETVEHRGPSTIGIDTIYRSQGNIPEVFLKGAGVDDTFITYIRSLIGKPIEYYSCFISYSSKDEAFAKRLYADLQSSNVRCWFAPEDLKIGDKLRPRIDESIRFHDKLLLVLSEYSTASQWVEQEVATALARERKEQRTVLFPIRLDNAILEIESD